MKKILLISMLFIFGCSDSPTYLYVEDSAEQPYMIVNKVSVHGASNQSHYDENFGDIQIYYLSKQAGYSNRFKIYVPKKWDLSWEAGDKIMLVSEKEYGKLHDIILSLEKGERPRLSRRLDTQLDTRVEDIEDGTIEMTDLEGIW